MPFFHSWSELIADIILAFFFAPYAMDRFFKWLYWKTGKEWFKRVCWTSSKSEVDAYCAARVEELKQKLEKRNGRN